MIVAAGIIICKGKAFIPTQGQLDDGPYIDIEPVYEVDLRINEIRSALEAVISTGHPVFPTPTKEEWQNRVDPVLEATGYKNWKALARNAASYSLHWHKDEITLYFSKLDAKGRFETDTDKTMTFPINTNLDIIIEAVLKDVYSRPELTNIC